MNLRCPVCKAENTAGPACRRCRADLSLLVAVEARRDFHLSLARVAIRDGQYDTALEELDLGNELRCGTDILPLRAAVSLLAGDYAAALAEHQRLGG